MEAEAAASARETRYVAKEFNKAKIGTLLFDLLTSEEEEQDTFTAEYRFNIDLLAERLIGATQHLKKDKQTKDYPFGYFGASTGAAAALISRRKTSQRHRRRGLARRTTRPCSGVSPKVKAPTLLLVGGLDTEVIELNREAMAQMTAEKKLIIIPGATHLFEEPGKLEEVAKISTDWFLTHLTKT